MDVNSRKESKNLSYDIDFKELLNKAKIPIVVGSKDGYILHANELALKLFECELKDLVGKHFLDITAFESIEKSMMYWEKLKSGKIDSYSFEKVYILPKTQKEIHMSVSVNPVNDDNGNMKYVVVTLRKIPKEVKILEDKVKTLEIMFNLVELPLAIINKDGSILRANKFFFKFFGIDEENVISTKIWNFVKESLMLEMNFRSYIIKKEKDIRLEVNLLKSPSEVIKSKIFISKLEENKFLVQIVEILGEEKLYENYFQKLFGKKTFDLEEVFKHRVGLKLCEGKECIYRSTYNKFDTIVHVTSDLSIKEIDLPENSFEQKIKGADILYVNKTPVLDNIIFNSPSIRDTEIQVIEKGLEKSFKTEALNAVKKFIDEYENNKVVEFTIYFPQIDEEKFFEIRGKKKGDEYVLIIRDITAQKKYENLLKAERDILRKEMEEKRRFWSVVSHEMRTPLNSILGFIQLLEKESLSKHQMDYLKTIKISSETLLSLISDVLEYSKLEELGQVEPKETIIPDILIESLKLLWFKAREKNININTNIDPKIPFSVLTDSYKLRRVITNLLDNAIKFSSRDSEVDLEVNLLEDRGKECHIEFIVRDRGIGIPKEKINDIFKPFAQVDSSLSRRYGGTGLGLSIAKRIIDILNGQIKVESEINKGTTFRIYLTSEKVKGIDILTYLEDKILESGYRIVFSYDLLESSSLKMLKNYFGRSGEILDKSVFFVSDLQELMNSLTEEDTLVFVGCDFLTNQNAFKKTLVEDLKDKNQKVKIILVVPLSKINEIPEDVKNQFDAVIDEFFEIGEFISLIESEEDHFTNTEIKEEELIEKLVGKNISIMVVEDNLVNMMFISKVLERIGINATLCSTSFEALENIRKKKFDMIFMDVQMQGLDGYELTKIIRKEPLKEQPIIVGLSAQAFKEDIEEGLSSGMDEYLTKPVSIEKIYQTIYKYLILKNSSTKEKKTHITKEKIVEEKILDEKAITRLESVVSNPDEKRKFFESLLTAFENSFQTTFDSLKKASSNNDLESARKSAHSIKGGAYELGFVRLGNIFKNIENNAREGKNVITPELVDEIQDVYTESIERFKKWLKKQ